MKKITIRSLLAWRGVPFIAVPLIALVVYQLVGVLVKTLSTERTIADLKRQVSELEASKRTLEQFNDFLNSDFFAEKEAREKLGMQKQGEQAVVIPDFSDQSQTEERKVGTNNTSFDTAGNRAPNISAWKEYFLGGADTSTIE